MKRATTEQPAERVTGELVLASSVRAPFEVKPIPSDAVIVDALRRYHGMADVVASKLGVSCEALAERMNGREDFDMEIRLAKERLNASKKLALANALAAGDLAAMSLELARQKVEQNRGGGGGNGSGADQPIDFTREVESVRDLTYAEIVASLRQHVMKWNKESGEPCPTCGAVHVRVADETKTKDKE